MAPRKKRNVSQTVKHEPTSEVLDELPHNMGKVQKPKIKSPDTEVDLDKIPQKSPDSDEPTEAASIVKQAKKAAHKYKLNYEESPFPGHALPTPEAAEEVHRLLTKEHGECKPPAKIPPPSATRSGCGEVPDLLDALIRTVLSANTTGKNSSEALQGLIKTFGSVGGSPDWNVVSQAKPEQISKAIFKGGLSVVKGKNIKSILTIIRAQNIERRDALIKEKKTGKPANVPATSHLTQVQKDAEIARIEENPLTMAWIFEIKKDSDVIDELIKLPGIGVKTASCCLLFNLQRPSFAVDTHVLRHCKWLGWVPPNATADQTFNHCDLRLPNHLKYGLHTLFIRHGKTCYKCRAITNPGSADWKKAKACPIEHLVDRSITKGGKKRKAESESEESDAEEATMNNAKKEKSDVKALRKDENPTPTRTRRARAAKATPVKYGSGSSEDGASEADSQYDG